MEHYMRFEEDLDTTFPTYREMNLPGYTGAGNVAGPTQDYSALQQKQQPAAAAGPPKRPEGVPPQAEWMKGPDGNMWWVDKSTGYLYNPGNKNGPAFHQWDRLEQEVEQKKVAAAAPQPAAAAPAPVATAAPGAAPSATPPQGQNFRQEFSGDPQKVMAHLGQMRNLLAAVAPAAKQFQQVAGAMPQARQFLSAYSEFLTEFRRVSAMWGNRRNYHNLAATKGHANAASAVGNLMQF